MEESVYATLEGVDAYQTEQIGQRHEDYYEEQSRWAIGREPSKRSVLLYMGAAEVAHLAIGLELDKLSAPRWLRRVFEGFYIGQEARNVTHNARIGL